MAADLFTATGAALSDCRRYRLRLWRQWDPDGRALNWIMLNPSTADEDADDPTIRRCLGFARAWGFGSIVVTNLFALRATSPRELRRSEDPVGFGNDVELFRAAVRAHLVVCAWGNHGAYQGRGFAVARVLRNAGVQLHCLAVTKTGQPSHPLYLPKGLRPVLYEPPPQRGLP